MNRLCKKCHTLKPLSEFYILKSGKEYTWCKKCARKNAKAWGEKHKSHKIWSEIKRNYGLSKSEYKNILKQQRGVCKICVKPCGTFPRLSVDHCHKTGEVRGLLCAHCNRGLEAFKDNIIILENAIIYSDDRSKIQI